MDDPCPIQRDKKLLNLLTKELDHVISQEYFKSQMAVCQKYLEGEPNFFAQKIGYTERGRHSFNLIRWTDCKMQK